MRKLALLLTALLLTPTVEAQTANTATITFTAPTKRVDGTTPTGVISYNIYQGVGTGTSKTKVGTITATTASITTGLLGGTQYCWQVTAQEAGGPESGMSNEACKTFSLSPMTTVTITVQ